jgi:DNA-binding GntR family transcriptional regulator
VEDAIELYQIRLLLDPMALRQSIAAALDNGFDDYAVRVDAAHRAMQRRGRTVAEARDAHREFHMALVAWCPNRHLVRHVVQLLDQTQRFQAIAGTARRLGDAAAEHAALADAATRGDADLAAGVLTAHLEGTLDAARRALA